MALSELTSNLSWYGTNAGFRPAGNVDTTRFNYDPGDLTVAIAPRGFDNAGFQSNAFMPRISGNSFNISNHGTSTRRSQLGTGTKFPIGPKGEVHEFDIKRTGFHDGNRYETLFNSKSTKGLGDTYTVASPIDDMYNKFKVRDEVYDPFGYAKPPFILRGIQRDESSKPQRWGFGDTTAGVISSLLDIPRGGPLTMGDRIANDAVRLGKMLIRPQGIAFVAKQQLLHLMQPNTEGVTGYPNLNILTNQKISNPLNTIASALGSPLGLRFKKYGLLPIDDGVSKYEDIHRLRDIASLSGIPVNVKQNRLVLLNGDRNDTFLPTWLTLDSIAGPNSIGGLGSTTFRKRSEYDTQKIGTTLQRSFDTSIGRTFKTQYTNLVPYIAKGQLPADLDSRIQPITFAERIQLLDPTAYDSLKSRIAKNDFTAIPQKNEPSLAASNTTREADKSSYNTLAYGTIKSLAKSRPVKTTAIVDFTTGQAFSPSATPIGKKLTSAQSDTIIDNDPSLIVFKIGTLNFKANLTQLSFNDALSVDEKKELMAPFGQYVFSALERSVSFGFMIAARNEAQLTENWQNIKKLQGLLAPDLGNGTRGVLRARSTNITIGSIFKESRVIIESVSFDIDQESPWNITANNQYAYYINVDVQCRILPTSKTSLPTINA
jgi:hypothetical protein